MLKSNDFLKKGYDVEIALYYMCINEHQYLTETIKILFILCYLDNTSSTDRDKCTCANKQITKFHSLDIIIY